MSPLQQTRSREILRASPFTRARPARRELYRSHKCARATHSASYSSRQIHSRF